MKYDALGAFLDALDEDERTLDTKGIERVLGTTLPKSARHKAFWSNNRQGKAQAGPGWLNVGWRVAGLHHERGRVVRVTFRRDPRQAGGTGPTIVDLSDEDKTRMRRPNLETQQTFYYSAGDHMMNHYSDYLGAGEAKGVDHRFDFVSENRKIVGEMRLFRSIPTRGIHSSTFASISEAVLFLQHADAKQKFIVFGGEQRVPEAWLQRHAALAVGIAFYFIRADGELLTLQPAQPVKLAGGHEG